MKPDFIAKDFTSMQENGWDINAPLKWGFYFVSKNKENLFKIFNELKDHNYKLEGIDQREGGNFWLSVSKIEALEQDKLRKRNASFHELAAYFNSTYDGLDVGKQ